MDRKLLKEICEQLIDRCKAIGNVVGCNAGYTDLLWWRLKGKSIGEMRVDELIAEIEAASIEYNELHRSVSRGSKSL